MVEIIDVEKVFVEIIDYDIFIFEEVLDKDIVNYFLGKKVLIVDDLSIVRK